MPIKALKFKPGIMSDITSYSNEGGYVDGVVVAGMEATG